MTQYADNQVMAHLHETPSGASVADPHQALLTEGMILEAPAGTVLSDHLGRPIPVPSGRAAFELHDYIGQTADGTPIWGGDILDATNTLFPWGYTEFTVSEMWACGLLRSAT